MATSVLQQTLKEVLPLLVSAATASGSGNRSTPAATAKTALHAICTALSQGLQYRYQACYPLVMQVGVLMWKST